VYHKTDVLGLQTLLQDKFGKWASNGSCVEEIWKNFEVIVSECIEGFVPQRIFTKKKPGPGILQQVKRL
jgi:hypothetical protein